MFAVFLNPLAILMSFSTATGVLIHDMHIDNAAAAVMAMPGSLAHYETSNKLAGLDGTTHTHVERGAYSQPVAQLHGDTPRLQPRASEDKKHLLQKRVMRRHHAFDNYNLPIVS